MKVEIKLNGKKENVYEFERYYLWKLGKIKVDSKLEKEYQEKLEAENKKPEKAKILGATQYQVLSNRIAQLENKVQELSLQLFMSPITPFPRRIFSKAAGVVPLASHYPRQRFIYLVKIFACNRQAYAVKFLWGGAEWLRGI